MDIDRANADNHNDTTYATVIVRSIMQEVLPYLNIYMSEPVTDEEREELDELGLAVTYTGDEPSDKWEKDDDY